MTETTRERIKTESMRLFVDRGVDAVSVRDIAQAVGMKASNLYAHFPGKGALIRELFAEGYAAYGEQLRAVRGADCLARLDAMVRLICRLHDTDLLRFRFLLLTQHGGLAEIDVAAADPIGIVHALVAEAMAAGEIPAGEAALVTAMVVGIVLQAATFRLYGRLDRDLGDVADLLAAACRRATGARSFLPADRVA